MKTTALFVAGTFLLAGLPASADPWIAPGDARLRHDLQLLADAGIVGAPLTTWPVSWGEVSRDLARNAMTTGRSAWIDAAFARVSAAARDATRTGRLTGDVRLSGAEAPMGLRRFAGTPREEGELSAGLQYTGSRIAYRLEATAVSDADDGKEYRADGSYVAVAFENWMLHAGYVDRWWGPGWEGSLIYGNNARPLPSITIERNHSDPFRHRWLRWIGQWRFAATMGRFEGDRGDAPDANFFGARLTLKPHPRVEVGVSRSAQWCGDGRPCGLDTFWDLLTGNDNDQPIPEQPGNQQGGFDVRWSLPGAPVAVYAQAIGEDEASMLPSKYLGLAGLEVWGGLGERSWRAHLEFADTACSFYQSDPQFGCAYRNSIYTDGYQYRDRVLGHSLDGDSQQVAVGVMLIDAHGRQWQVAAQDARVNRANASATHTVSPTAAKIRSADLYHRRSLLGGDLNLGLGYERRETAATGSTDEDMRAFVQWRREFR